MKNNYTSYRTILVLMVLLFSFSARTQTTIVNYDFNAGSSDATLTPALASGITAVFSCTQAWQTYTGTVTGANAFTVNSNAGNSRGMALSSGTDTKWYNLLMGGSSLPVYKTFKIYFQAQRSASGAQVFTVKYSKDGGAFNSFTGNTMAPGNGSFAEGLFSLPADADNPVTSLEIRISVSGASGTGTCRIDNLQIQGVLSATPVLNVSPSSNLTGFYYLTGTGPSPSQVYNLSGLNLVGYPGNITVTGTTNYEVSTDNVTFSSSVNIPFTSSTLSSTPLYVRLMAGLGVGYYNLENIVNSGGGATINVTCSGYVLPMPLTYTWQGADAADWTVDANWSPPRTVPYNNDILHFNDGTSKAITAVPTQTIGQMVISNNTTIELRSASTSTLSIMGGAGVDLNIQSGSALNIAQATSAIVLSLNTGTTGTIGGNVTFSNNAHKLLAADAGGITFQNGAVFTAGTGFSSNAFGTTNLGSVIFAGGSKYIAGAGANPFGASAPFSVVVWQPGSTYVLKNTGAPSLGNRTYADFELDLPSAANPSFTSGSPLTMDNFIVTSGTWSIGVRNQWDIKKNLTVASGATINLNPTSAGTIVFSGTVVQSIGGQGTLATNTFQGFAVNNTAVVTLNRELTLNGPLTVSSGGFTVTSGASLITNGAVSGNITVERNIPGAATSWHLLSSPVSGQAISPAFTLPSSTDYDFYTWYEPTGTWVNFKNTTATPTWNTANGSNNFLAGRGYLVEYNEATPTKYFSGAPNTGTITYPLSKSGSGIYAGYNLAGNPYPSPIDWKAATGWVRNFVVMNSGGYDMSIWNDAAGNYGTFNSAGSTGTNGVTQYIPVGQGFMVLADAAGNLEMNNDVRVHNTQPFLKSDEIENILKIKVTGNANSYSDEVAVEFGHENQEGGAMKMFSFVDAAPSLYVVKPTGNYSVDFRGEPGPVAIPVSFKAGVSGTYTLTASQVESFTSSTQITLEDVKTGKFQNLIQNPAYEFIATKDDGAERFILHFGGAFGINDNAGEHQAGIYSSGHSVYISNPSGNTGGIVTVYNMVGQIVISQSMDPGILTKIDLNGSTGYYLVRVISGNKAISGKVFISL